jgi:RNA polymerase sigma factor (sigma-70 family)
MASPPPEPNRSLRDVSGDTSVNVRAAIRGDPDALAWTAKRLSGLFEFKARLLVRRAGNLVGEPEDLVQDMWAAALPKLGNIVPRNGRYTPVLIKYLGKLLNTKFQDALRAGLRRRARGERPSDGTTSDEPVSPALGPVSTVEINEVGDLVRTAMSQLGAEEQELVIMRAVDGTPYSTLSARFGLKPNTLTQRYRRAIAKILGALPPFESSSILRELSEDDDELAGAEGRAEGAP